MRPWVLVGVVALVAACGSVTALPDAPPDTGDPGPDLNDGARSGSRLKLRYYDFGSARDLVGVRDTQRNEDCTPQDWADGKAYCVPNSLGGIVYANAACTQLLGETYVPAGCTRPPPAYFIDYAYQGCEGNGAHLYPRGTKLAATQYWQKSSNGACNGPYTSTNSEYYALGTEVRLTDLAETPISAPSTTGRLGQRYYESADGLRYPLRYRLHDALLGVDCYPTYDIPGSTTGRCIPANTGSTYYFRDAACTLRQVSTATQCAAPKFAATYGDCPYEPAKYFTVGSQLSPSMIYYDTGSSCAATAPSATTKYYALGAELMLAATARTRQTGPGRVQAIYYTTPEGLRNRDYTLFDAEIGVECYARKGADGSITCVPDASSMQTFYTDAACQSAIELMTVYRGPTTCSPPPLPSYAIKNIQTAGTCEYDYEVHRVGTVYTGALFTKSGTSCTAYTTTTSILYRILEVVPQSELASGTLVTEP